MKKIFISLLCSITLACTLLLCGCNDASDNASSDSDAPKAKCTNGVMVGQEKNEVVSYLGIPYAKPPVDELRWKAPVAAEKSDEEILCTEYGDTALQYEWPTERASYAEKSEDCLSLNIWSGKSESKDEAKPVMVWIHGGSLGWGGTTDPIYDGQNFAEANPDVILVTINYRLGIMAWADFSEVPGGEEYTDVNLGIRDQICALQWVQENISAFGGDPDNVTIFGESSGGGSVNTLVASPATEGLFQKAIVESGSNCEPGTRADAKEFANLMLETAGCKNMEEMCEISGEKWMALDTENWLADELCGIVVDDEIVPADFEQGMKNAAARGVKLLIGYNGDEDYYFVQELEGDDKVQQWSENHEKEWDETYASLPADGKALMDKYMQIQTDQGKDKVFAISEFKTDDEGYYALKWATAFSDGGGDVYMYYWDVPSTSKKYFKGACHAVELAYVFNNLQETIYCGKNPDKTTAEKTQAAWTSFAKNGNPSTEETEWTTFHGDTKDTMMITLDGWSMQENPMSEQREIYKDLKENYIQ